MQALNQTADPTAAMGGAADPTAAMGDAAGLTEPIGNQPGSTMPMADAPNPVAPSVAGGAPAAPASAGQQPMQPQFQPQPQPQPQPGNGNNKRPLIIAVAAVVVILVIAFFAFSGNGSSSGGSSSASTPSSSSAASSSAPAASSSSASDSSSSSSEAGSIASSAASGGAGSAAASASSSSSGSQGFDTWAAECTDKWDTPTGYAISELKGWQLETLLQQLGYTWSASDGRWSDGQTNLYVFNGNTEPLTDEEIGILDKGGAGTPALFQIETKNYPAAQSAYRGLVGEVMVSEDSEFLDGMGFGIAYGPSMSRLLVYVTEDGDNVDVFFFNEKAIESGMFDRITGGSYGTSVKEAFNNVVGR